MPAPTTGCKLTNYHKAYLPVQCDILCNCCSSVPLTHIFISSSKRSTTQEIIRHKTKQKIIVRLSFYNIFSVWVWLWNAFLTQSRLDEQMNKHGGQNPENITSLPTMSGSVKAPQNAREKYVRSSVEAPSAIRSWTMVIDMRWALRTSIRSASVAKDMAAHMSGVSPPGPNELTMLELPCGGVRASNEGFSVWGRGAPRSAPLSNCADQPHHSRLDCCLPSHTDHTHTCTYTYTTASARSNAQFSQQTRHDMPAGSTPAWRYNRHWVVTHGCIE